MSRTPRPIDVDKVTIAVLLLLGRSVEKPCPTLQEFVECTGIPRRRMWQFLMELQERGLIEIEERGHGEGRARRMRQNCGSWTAWTQRRPAKHERALLLEAMRA